MTYSVAKTRMVAEEIMGERMRQVHVERYTPEHDDRVNGGGELAMAAMCYVAASSIPGDSREPVWWPWNIDAWKPQTVRRDLIKAAALIVAEIERLDRRANPE